MRIAGIDKKAKAYRSRWPREIKQDDVKIFINCRIASRNI